MGFYSQLIQNCEIGVKVMTEVDDKGKVVGIEEVAHPDEPLGHVCPIERFKDDKLSAIRVEGSHLTCLPECVFRTKEG